MESLKKCVSAAQLSNRGDEGTAVWLHVITSRWIDRLTLKERLHIQLALRPSRKGDISLRNKREWYKSVIYLTALMKRNQDTDLYYFLTVFTRCCFDLSGLKKKSDSNHLMTRAITSIYRRCLNRKWAVRYLVSDQKVSWGKPVVLSSLIQCREKLSKAWMHILPLRRWTAGSSFGHSWLCC